MLPRAFLREKEFDAEVKRVEKLLGDRVMQIRYGLDYDSTGEPCVKFRIRLPDSAAVNGRIFNAARALESVIEEEMSFCRGLGHSSLLSLPVAVRAGIDEDARSGLIC